MSLGWNLLNIGLVFYKARDRKNYIFQNYKIRGIDLNTVNFFKAVINQKICKLYFGNPILNQHTLPIVTWVA